MVAESWRGKVKQLLKKPVFIVLNWTSTSVTIREVSKMEFYFCPSGDALFELPYAGNGIFCGQDVIEFKQEGWGLTQRYKFLVCTMWDGEIQYWVNATTA